MRTTIPLADIVLYKRGALNGVATGSVLYLASRIPNKKGGFSYGYNKIINCFFWINFILFFSSRFLH